MSTNGRVIRQVPVNSSNIDAWRFLFLPVLIGVISGAGANSRWYRTIFLEEMNREYVRTARAKGLVEQTIVIKHAMRNALIPIVTVVTLLFGELLAGAVLTEQIFTIPGFGKLVVDAVFNRDYAVVQGIVLCTAITFILMNILADALYRVLNPRMNEQ